MKLTFALLVAVASAVRVEESGQIFYATHDDKIQANSSQSLVEQKYGDVTVFISPRAKGESIDPPERYS